MFKMRKEIEDYIIENYNPLKENPWDDTPNFTTFKHKDNQKWFALIMDIPYEKVGVEKEGLVSIINLKNIPEMLGGLRKTEGILPAYHMNKEHWITVLLDGTVSKDKIYGLIDISFDLTAKKKKIKMEKKNDKVY